MTRKEILDRVGKHKGRRAQTKYGQGGVIGWDAKGRIMIILDEGCVWPTPTFSFATTKMRMTIEADGKMVCFIHPNALEKWL